jgi:putative acetyltransferase
MITTRQEREGDQAAVRRVNEEAFGQPDEADLVDALRMRAGATLSLVALQGDRSVGHILFSPATIRSERSSFNAVALGPMAVLPAYQNTGIGTQLVLMGLHECREAGHEVVIVLGHANYYPRFGFVPAKSQGIRWEFDVPDDAFMVMELHEGALAGRGGVVKYQPEFTIF